VNRTHSRQVWNSATSVCQFGDRGGIKLQEGEPEMFNMTGLRLEMESPAEVWLVRTGRSVLAFGGLANDADQPFSSDWATALGTQHWHQFRL
jgi:hypothetical protein